MRFSAGKVFVTGATGFLGINLIRQLVHEGWEVYALFRFKASLKYLNDLPITKVQGDVLDLQSLIHAMPDGLDVVFHMAGDTKMWAPRNQQQTEVNVTGTQHVVEACLSKQVGRLVHTSTLSAYGRHKQVIDEHAKSNARYSNINYEQSKYLAELYIKDAVENNGLNAVIVNPGAILGPYDSGTWAQVFFMLRDGAMPACPPGSISFNHVANVVDAHIRAAEIGAVGENYLLGGNTVTFKELFCEMASAMEVKAPRLVAPAPVIKAYARLLGLLSVITKREPSITPEKAAFMVADNLCFSGKAIETLGYQPESIQKCVADSYAWLSKEGYLS